RHGVAQRGPTVMAPDRVLASTSTSRPSGRSMRGRPERLFAFTCGRQSSGNVIEILPDIVSTSIGPAPPASTSTDPLIALTRTAPSTWPTRIEPDPTETDTD